jgi:molybdenum cofactor synthesis domain-containing protein
MTTACLIIIGNEILSGRTQDKNLSYIAEKLNEVGIRVMETRVIPDIESTIIDTVNELRARFDYVFTTGGIGPKHDDITSASVAKAFGVKLIRHPEAVRLLEESYAGRDVVLNEARLRMADIPEGATLVLNSVTAAPGFNIGNVYVMAGVPKIMQAMLATVLPTLSGSSTMHSVSIKTNLPEGTIADGLTDIQNAFPDVEIGSYPHFVDGGYSTTLVSRSMDAAQANAANEAIHQLILKLHGKLLD